MQPAVSRPLVLLAVAAFVASCPLAAGSDSVRAAVVVLANQTRQNVDVSIQLGGQPESKVTLPPDRLIPVPVADAVDGRLQHGQGLAAGPAGFELPLLFRARGGEVQLKRVVFSRVGGVPWIHVDLSGKIPPPVVVPVKILDRRRAAGRPPSLGAAVETPIGGRLADLPPVLPGASSEWSRSGPGSRTTS